MTPATNLGGTICDSLVDFARLDDRMTVPCRSVVSVLGSKAAMSAPEAFGRAVFG